MNDYFWKLLRLALSIRKKLDHSQPNAPPTGGETSSGKRGD